MNPQWRWLFWQVFVPIGGPIIVATGVIALWATGDRNFTPNFNIVLDVSPWALTFYTLTLIGSTLNVFWPKLANHQVLGGALFVVAIAVSIYAAFTVIWRHDSNFEPGYQVYFVAVVLLLVAVGLCHQSYAKTEGSDHAG